jgi:hypothetical protein
LTTFALAWTIVVAAWARPIGAATRRASTTSLVNICDAAVIQAQVPAIQTAWLRACGEKAVNQLAYPAIADRWRRI